MQTSRRPISSNYASSGQPRWGVYSLRGKRAERIAFSVQARDSKEAIERAVKEFEIPERERWRISVQREV